ncbi:MAG TPA: ATP-binding protein [Vicinamibacterales bacterium]
MIGGSTGTAPAAAGSALLALADLRRLRRLALWGVIGALAVLAAGRGIERWRLGTSDRDAVARIASRVQAEFSTLADALTRAARRAVDDPADVAAARTDDGSARRLFDAADAALETTRPAIDALSIHDATGLPLAWAGRPSTLPVERLNGPGALFVAPGPLGLRLVRVDPIVAPGEPQRRIGTVVAEAVLTREAALSAAGAPFVYENALVPIALRPRYEGGGDSVPPYGFLLSAPDGTPLLEAELPAGSLDRLRYVWRARTNGAALALLAICVLLVALALRDSQERALRVGPYLQLAAAILLLIVAARALLALAVPPWWSGSAASGLIDLLCFRTPADWLATSLLLLAVAALAGDAVERARLARRAHRVSRGPLYWLMQAAVGAVAGLILLGHARILERVVAGTEAGLAFSLHPFEPARLVHLAGVALFNAAAAWLVFVVLRAAATRARVARRDIGTRTLLGLLYAVPAALVLTAAGTRVFGPLLALPVAAIAAVGIARWVIPRYRHAAQGTRLTVAYLALTVPSLALYPAIVAFDHAAVERRIETEYAAQALNHRDDLRDRLRRSLEQIDALPLQPGQLVEIGAEPGGLPDADRAFLLWSQTELARERLTSSLELYNGSGDLVSRFALNLPAEFLSTEHVIEIPCTWATFGEVLASTDDQLLLHAGRAICAREADGTLVRQGAILVHVVLDYSTLPFVAATDPSALLVRAGAAGGRLTHGRDIEFAVYGWGRTPVYPTAGTAWPINTELLRRIYRAGRTPFWETLSRGGRDYRVLLSNDRAGIYAIGYELPRPMDHAVALAEIGTLGGAVFVVLLGLVGGLSRLAGRTPSTGRALLREIRRSFYRKLFLLFVAASVLPVLALAFVTRAYVAGQLQEGLESGALRTASTARRVIETVMTQQRRGDGDPVVGITDQILVSVSRIIDQDVNVFVRDRLAATSQRDLFASGLLPTRTPSEVARAIGLERQSSYVGDERVAGQAYTIAAVPVRDGEGGAILTVPLTLRQREIEREIDTLDRRVTLAAVLFILLGAGIGYVTAERLADPIARLTRATRRIARGDLDARILRAPADELGRLVEAFNQMAADLERQRSELERTNRLAARADMARQVAHDIKNPLTPIQLSAEFIQRVHHDSGAPLGPVVDNCIATILSQVTMLRQIASEFSSFASSPVARPAPHDVNVVVDEVLAPYRTGLPANVTLHVTLGDGVPVLPLDRALLSRALVNLIENALHAMRGGGELHVSTAVTPDGGAVIVIRDTGVGMDDEAKARLFEPYFSTKATGTGLGLTIAKRNVELNRGTLDVASEKGRGTTVTVTLPPPAPPDAGADAPATR